MSSYFTALIMSLIEGATEFLPISSSAHLLLAGDLLGFTGEKAEIFEVIIQLGAILAVVVLYWSRFWGLLRPQPYARFAGMRGIWLLVLTTFPVCVAGLLLHSTIKKWLSSPFAIVIGLVAGSLCMFLTEHKNVRPTCVNLDELTPKMALGIGLCQCAALWPGFSRSGATIMGGLLLGAKRGLAVQYSFIAAVPVMFAASFYVIVKNYAILNSADFSFFALGLAGALLSALLGIRFFISLLGRVTLVPFAIYRLVLAPLIFYFVVL